MKYTTILHKSEYGFDVHVPALPGCHSQGETEAEALANIQDAIQIYLGIEAADLKGAYAKDIEISLNKV